MKKVLLILFFGALSLGSFAQSDTITAANSKNYIGKEVVLKGILKGYKPFKDRNDRDILFLDIDETYPNTAIGVTVFPDAFSEVNLKPEDIGKTVLISGFVEDYRGKPSLPIREGSQLKVL